MDTVKHRPTGETWLVAYVNGDRLAWRGWPEGEAEVADCDLLESCSDAEHLASLHELADRDIRREGRHGGGLDRRCQVARQQLAALMGWTPTTPGAPLWIRGTGLQLIADERKQIAEADPFTVGRLCDRAVAALLDSFGGDGRVTQLVTFGALIAAEIDRRLEGPVEEPPQNDPEFSTCANCGTTYQGAGDDCGACPEGGDR